MILADLIWAAKALLIFFAASATVVFSLRVRGRSVLGWWGSFV